jgi:abhydrolase domain-containing protein 17
MDKRNLKRSLIGAYSRKRLFRSTLICLLLVYLGIAVYAHFNAEKFLFQPQHPFYRDTDQILKLTSGDGVQISARYLPNPKATYTLLYSHGNAEDIGLLRSTLEELRRLGFSVFAYDYQGYGTSGGTPSEAHACQDIDAAYNYLINDLGIPPHRIIAYGRSIGGAVAIDLAHRKLLGGLILESSFLSAYRIVTRIPLFPFDKFQNLAKIKKVHCPVLILHGKQDQTAPFWHGERLFQEANAPKKALWVDKAGHNNIPEAAASRYKQALQEFATLCATNRP